MDVLCVVGVVVLGGVSVGLTRVIGYFYEQSK